VVFYGKIVAQKVPYVNENMMLSVRMAGESDVLAGIGIGGDGSALKEQRESALGGEDDVVCLSRR
jgi:hypothetical protein